MSPNNFRRRVLGRPAAVVDGDEKPGTGAVGRANKTLEAEGLRPLPLALTPHSLRRTFCSLLYALGESPPIVMREMGHTDPALALKIYAQVWDRGGREGGAASRGQGSGTSPDLGQEPLGDLSVGRVSVEGG
jgi:integrase